MKKVQHPDEILFFSGNTWGVRIEDFVAGLEDEKDFWNINEFFTLASDGELVQALVISVIFRSGIRISL